MKQGQQRESADTAPESTVRSTMPDELKGDYDRADRGRGIVRALKQELDLTEYDLWIIVPSDNDQLNRIALGDVLKTYVNEQYYRRAIVLISDGADVDIDGDRKLGGCKITFRHMAADDLADLLAYYRLVQFADDVIVVSLEEPYSCSAWIGNCGITLEQFVRDGIYYAKPVNWGWWNVSSQIVVQAIKDNASQFEGKNVYVFGQTRFAGDICHSLRNCGFEVAGLLDGNLENEGFNGELSLCCLQPERALCPYDADAVIVVVERHARAMRGRLAKLGYQDDQICEIPINWGIARPLCDDETTLEEEFSKACAGYKLRQQIGDEMLVTSIGGTGDVFWLCALLPGYLKRFSIEDYTLLLENRKSSKADVRVAGLFGIDGIRTCPIDDLLALYKAWDFFGSRRMNMKPDLHLGSRLVRNVQPKRENGHYPPWRNHLNSMRFQYFYYKGPLELAVPARYPVPEDLFSRVGLRPGMTVVLAPYANAYRSRLIEHTDLWSQLARALVGRGYDVCTNCATDEKAIEGAPEICVPFDEVVDFLNRAGGFVSIRSGLCDIASAASDCTMVLLYEQGTGIIPDTFSLKRMGVHPHAIDLVCTGDVEELLREILEQFPPLDSVE